MGGSPPARSARPVSKPSSYSRFVATYLAVDVGGTKLAVGLVDDRGRVLDRDGRPTDRSDPWPDLEALVTAVLHRAGSDRPAAVGVGCGGPMREGGDLVSPLNIPGWRDFPLRPRLMALTGLPVAVDNDAKALALGEGWCGAAAGITDYVAMVVSTGVGGGIVLDGRLLDGATGNAGHVGHLVVEPDGRDCVCGSRGCLEAEASGLAIAAVTGRPAAEAPLAVRERTGRLVGRAVADVCVLLDLGLAIVAGSVALGFGDVFFAAAQAELDRRARISYARNSRIVPAGLGADGPLVGAAAVARRTAHELTGGGEAPA
jgi:glucokinase